MAVKRCNLITERYKIDAILYPSKSLTVDVRLIDGPCIIYGLNFVDNEALCFAPGLSKYYCEEFYKYIKSFLDDALKWDEYWECVSENFLLDYDTMPDIY